MLKENLYDTWYIFCISLWFGIVVWMLKFASSWHIGCIPIFSETRFFQLRESLTENKNNKQVQLVTLYIEYKL